MRRSDARRQLLILLALTATTLAGGAAEAAETLDLKPASGFVNYGRGYDPARVSLAEGQCVVSGLLRSSSTTIRFPATLATLPKECWPSKHLVFNLSHHEATNRVDVTRDGKILWRSRGGRHSWVNLAGMTFTPGAGGRPLTLAKTWKDYARSSVWRGAAYTRTGELCLVSGLIEPVSSKHVPRIPGEVVAQLPTDCRPKQSLIFNLQTQGQPAVRVDVSPDGRITWLTGKPVTRPWLSLTGITFVTGAGGKQLELINGWTDHRDRSFRGATLARVGDICVLSGLIQGKQWTEVAKLPDYCRPTGRLIFNTLGVPPVGNTSRYGMTPTRVDVLEDGRVVWRTGGKNDAFNLTGIAFVTHAKPGTPPPPPPPADPDAIALASGWTNYARTYGTARLDLSDDLCVVSGLIKPTASTFKLPAHVATLPRFCWPSRRLIFNLSHHESTNRVDVLPDGKVIWQAKGSRHAWLSLSGMTFAPKNGGTPMAPANGWADYARSSAYRGATYVKVGDLCLVSGLIEPASSRLLALPKELVATLPPDCRPDQDLVFNLRSRGTGATRVDVDRRGNVIWRHGVAGDGTWLSLTGIAFVTGSGGERATLVKGWQDIADRQFQGARIARQGDLCILSGRIRGNDFTDVAKLPEYCLPTGRLIFNVSGKAPEPQDSEFANSTTRLDVLADGRVIWRIGGKNATLNLTGINFYTKAKPPLPKPPQEEPSKAGVAFHKLQRVPAGTVAVLSMDVGRMSNTGASLSSTDIKNHETLDRLRRGARALVGRLREVGRSGMTVRNPMVFEDRGVTTAGGNGLRYGEAARFSLTAPGEFRLAPGTFYLADLHHASPAGGFGQACPACGDVVPDIDCGDIGPGPDPDCPECFGVDDVPPDMQFDIGGEPGACADFCPPSPAECLPDGTPPPSHDLPFGDVSCAEPPPVVPRMCQQLGSGAAGLIPHCRDCRADLCYSGDAGSTAGMLGDPECWIADYGEGSYPEHCQDMPNAQDALEQLAAEHPDLAPHLQYLACISDPGLAVSGICEAARDDAANICPTGSESACELLRQFDDPSTKFQKFCVEDRCVVCGPGTGRMCLGFGPDPRVVDEGEEPPAEEPLPEEQETGQCLAGGQCMCEGAECGETEEDGQTPTSEAETEPEEPDEPNEPEPPAQPEPDPSEDEDVCKGECEMEPMEFEPEPAPGGGEPGGGGVAPDGPGPDDPGEGPGGGTGPGGGADPEPDEPGPDPDIDPDPDDPGPDGPDDGGPDPEPQDPAPAQTDDPVNLGSGTLSMKETDVSFPSRGVSFRFTRRYSSNGIRSGALGPGWVHPFEDYIEIVGDRFNRASAPEFCTAELPLVKCLYRYDGYGGRKLYVFDGVTGLYAAGPGAFGVIRVSERGFTLRQPGGATRTYNLTGRLETIADAEGNGLTLHWRVRDIDEVERDGNPFRYGVGSLMDQLIEKFGVAFDGIGQVDLAFGERTHLFARLELDRIVDSYGREFQFVHASYPQDSSSNMVRRRRLSEIRYRGQTLVQYDYTYLEATREAYLTRVTRTGMTDGFESATPLVTRYEHQQELLKSGGLLGPLEQEPSGNEAGFRGRVLETLSRLQRDINVCTRVVLGIGSETTSSGDPCEEIVPESYEGLVVLNTFSLMHEVQLALADNIVRVYRGASASVPVLETYFEPDPTSADFDRAIKQRYGTHESLGALARQELDPASGDVLFEWRSSWPQVTFRQAMSGDPGSMLTQVQSVSRELEENVAGQFLDGAITRQAMIQQIDLAAERAQTAEPRANNDRNAAWFRDGVQVPAEVLAAVPLVESVPQGTPDHDIPEDEDVCEHFDSLDELPKFARRDPAGVRADRALGATPFVVRTRDSCAAVAGRQARDPFRNESVTYCGMPGYPACSEVAIPGQRRSAMEWDLARVCRWVQVENRDGRIDFYGLNFYGQALVAATPAANDDKAWNVTLRRYNADGLATLIQYADGAALSMRYEGQAPGVANVIKRKNRTRLRQVAATGGDLEPIPQGGRDWNFSYEPAFQQLSRVERPDGTALLYHYDYQQLHAGQAGPESDAYASGQTQQLANNLGRFGVRLPRFGNGLLLGLDLDGDGERGGEFTSRLVAVSQDKVALGGGQVGEVGVRYQRATSGQLMAESSIRKLTTPATDFDRTEYLYYQDLAAAESGDRARVVTSEDKPLGPLALVRVLRQPGATAATDQYASFMAYDALGGVRLAARDGDPETEVVTTRDRLGRLVRLTDRAGNRTEYRRDDLGDLKQIRRHDDTGHSPVQVSAVAHAPNGVPIGFCTAIAEGACDGFQGVAEEIVKQLREGNEPAVDQGRGWVVGVYDAADRLERMADSVGGSVVRKRNRAGRVVEETIEADPPYTRQYVHDRMGRLTQITTSPGSSNPLIARYRHDGFGRVSAVQTAGPISGTRLDPARGTVQQNQYDIVDRLVRTSTFGDDGQGRRRVLADTVIRRNELGAPLLVHDLAKPTLPSSLPAPPGGVAGGDGWASVELRYDPALRTSYRKSEGLTIASTFDYDGFGLVEERHPTHTRRVLWDPSNRLVQETLTLLGDNGPGALTSVSVTRMDGAGRPVRVDREDQAFTGLPRLRTTMVYDGLGQLVERTGSDNRRLRMTYDRAGLLREVVEHDPSGSSVRTTRWAYDSRGRPVELVGPQGQVVRTRYDASGRAVEETFGAQLPEKNRMVYAHRFDGAGRRLALERARDGERQTFSLDYAPNRAVANALRIDGTLAATTTLDGLDRPVVSVDMNLTGKGQQPGSRPKISTTLGYDTLGRVITDRTQAEYTGDEQPVTLSAIRIAYGDDYLGPRTFETQQERLAYTYSGAGNPVSMSRGARASQETVKLDFGWQARLPAFARLTLPGGQDLVHRRERDGYGRVIGTSLGVAGAPPMRRDDVLLGPAGRVTALRREGTRIGVRAKGYRYDGLGRLERHSYSEALGLPQFTAARGDALDEEGAGFALIPSDAPATASYTPADVLLGTSPDEWGRSYQAKDDPTSPGIPLSEVNGRSLQHDKVQRTTSDGRLQYLYDPLDRLVGMIGDKLDLEFAYDGLGRLRIQQHSGSDDQRIVLQYQGANLIETNDMKDGVVLRAVSHVPGVTDSPILVNHGPTEPSKQPAFVVDTDVRGDAVAAVDVAQGALVEEAVLGPWGERTFFDAQGDACVEGGEGPQASSGAMSECAEESPILSRFGIGGSRMIGDTKLVDLRARQYATHLRAFLTPDPAGATDSFGLWNYAAGDPINWRDPTGMKREDNDPAPDPTPGPAPVDPGAAPVDPGPAPVNPQPAPQPNPTSAQPGPPGKRWVCLGSGALQTCGFAPEDKPNPAFVDLELLKDPPMLIHRPGFPRTNYVSYDPVFARMEYDNQLRNEMLWTMINMNASVPGFGLGAAFAATYSDDLRDQMLMGMAFGTMNVMPMTAGGNSPIRARMDSRTAKPAELPRVMKNNRPGANAPAQPKKARRAVNPKGVNKTGKKAP